MSDALANIPNIDRALIGGVLIVALLALSIGRRGGHFRGLPGWAGFWVVFAPILICLSRLPPVISLPLLALLMFAGLRTYFFLVPVRPKDRSAHVAAYASIPVALYPGFTGSAETFLATVPVMLFLLFPALLAIGRAQQGFLDAVGRILLGVLLYVFCAAHLGLMVSWPHVGVLELYGVLVLAAELPQRLTGRMYAASWPRAVAGAVASAALTALAGWMLAPSAGLVPEDGARAGLLIVAAVTLGGMVGDAIGRDLGLSVSETRVGRGAFLERSIPAIYAAPIYFHYLNHFA